jgi:hypothetical protein
MGRLHQSRRQKIGYTYGPQTINDVSLQQQQRLMSLVQEQTFDQSMHGEGVQDVVKGIMKSKKQIAASQTPETIQAAVDNIDFSKPAKAISAQIPSITEKVIQSKPLKEAMKKILAKRNRGELGSGLSLAGGTSIQPSLSGGTSIQPSVGAGLSLAGAGELPGDQLKKKMLQKMVREKRMKSLGDRVKTTPIEAGMNGGSLVIAGAKGRRGTPGGQSASKTLIGMKKGYKLNPRPLVGAGKKAGKNVEQNGGFIFALGALIAGIASAASAAMATTVVGSVTVGSLVGAAATGAATASGKLAVDAVKKALKDKKERKSLKGSGRGEDLKHTILEAIKQTKLSLQDFPTKAKIQLKAGFEELKKNPTKEGIIALGKRMAPVARAIMKKKLVKKLEALGQKGQGLSLAGAGNVKKFDSSFVKHFTKKMTSD